MYANLIVGFDGSDAGRDGVALARRLALATGARVTAVYARSYLALSDDVRETDEDVPWNEAAERVLDGAREMLADIPGVMCRAVAERVPAHALHSAAEAADAALIVIGSTHRSGIGRIAPGTTADQILHAAPCAVAVAPAGYAEGATNQPLLVVGAAVDGAGESDRVARLAASIARRAGATLRLVTVAEHHSPAGPLYTGGVGYARSEAALRERTTETLEHATAAAGGSVRIERRVCEGDPADELVVQSAEMDLLVVGSRGLGALRRLVPGSTSASVVRTADCPVLVLPRGADERLDAVTAQLASGTWAGDR